MHDLTVVAIKKHESRLTTGEETIQRGRSAYLNEVVLLSHVVHTNVVKIIGFCLETKIPVLVYEFISNGTLSDHLYVEGEVSLAWSDRIRISREVAKAVSYLHSVASVKGVRLWAFKAYGNQIMQEQWVTWILCMLRKEDSRIRVMFTALGTAYRVGSLQYKEDKLTASPEVVAVDRCLTGTLLILASDGLWESLTQAGPCFFLQQWLIAKPWLQDRKGSPSKLAKVQLAKVLDEHATSLGSKDNVMLSL
ncbi:hypothetical protein EJB05_15658, partial [Eragrostis curvula]